MNSMVWYQPLIGPLNHELIKEKKMSREECLAQGRTMHIRQAKERVLSGLSEHEWRGSATVSSILNKTPQAIRRQIEKLVFDGVVEERIRPNSTHRKQWRVKSDKR